MGRIVVLVLLLLSLSRTVSSPSEQQPDLASTDTLPIELSERLRAWRPGEQPCNCLAAEPGVENCGECAAVRGASTGSSMLEQEAKHESTEGSDVDRVEQGARGEARAESGGAHPTRGEEGNAAEAAKVAGIADVSEQDEPRGEDEDDSAWGSAGLELGGWDVLPFSVQTLIPINVSLRLRGPRIARKCRFKQVERMYERARERRERRAGWRGRSCGGATSTAVGMATG
ncbi:hypothetical protein T484DRAFT_3354465 [Baffinella frigidus]|nr:hypothetical protein T484DRAFT_3354465 [Cryptophyta sp. CCMP2293]